jgi:hypothetical protein
MKLKREAHGLYLRFSSLDPWFLIGSGIEDMSVEMNGSFEQTKDVTGNVSVSDTGYQPQVGVEPYYANPDDSIYDKLKDLAMNRKSGDDAKAEMLEVLIDDTEATTHDGWTEDVKIEIASYGGDTSGMQISFNIWSDGNREQKQVKFTDKVPSIVSE